MSCSHVVAGGLFLLEYISMVKSLLTTSTDSRHMVLLGTMYVSALYSLDIDDDA